MLSPLRGEPLLRTLCDLLDDQGQAGRDQTRRLMTLDPTDHLTFAEAYCAVRDLPALTPELRRILLDHIFELMDTETARLLSA